MDMMRSLLSVLGLLLGTQELSAPAGRKLQLTWLCLPPMLLNRALGPGLVGLFEWDTLGVNNNSGDNDN